MTFTGRKALRGHATEFHALDKEIRWLTFHLGHAIVRGTDDVTYGSVDVMRSLIHQKTDQIERISNENEGWDYSRCPEDDDDRPY